MKKRISAVLIICLMFALCGCMYMEDHFTMNADGSGSLYSYVLIEKETYDGLMGILGEPETEDDAELSVKKVDGVEYYEMESSQEFSDPKELKSILSDSYEDVRVSKNTIAFRIAADEESMDGMSYEELKAVYMEQGIDIDSALEGYMVFHMPAPIAATTGELYEDDSTVIYYVNMQTACEGMEVFVTTSEAEAKNEAIRKGIENTSIKLSTSLTSNGKIKLSWKKAAGYKVDYYEVYRSTKKNSGYGKTPVFTTRSGSKTTYINTSVKSGTRYYYKVRGVRMVDGKKVYTPYSNIGYRKAR